MTGYTTHRLDGLEPDNLLAFMALLGLLRVLEEVRPAWRPRVSWTVNEPPLRPALRVPEAVNEAAVAEAAAEGLSVLAKWHDFDGNLDLALSPEEAAQNLRKAAVNENRYTADLWSALVSDAAIKIKRKEKEAEPTPLCLMFGQGHQHFLERLAAVPKREKPPERRNGRKKTTVAKEDCLAEALFKPWRRPDDTLSFRWDPHEDVRHALRARAPTDDKELTQHGANRLAAVGLSTLTVAPTRRAGDVKLTILGGEREARGGFVMRWPIWCDPVSLAGIRALLGHSGLGRRNTLPALGVVEVRRTKRTSSGKFMNFTRAKADPVP